MSTPYRESGKEIERRWADPAPRPLAVIRRAARRRRILLWLVAPLRKIQWHVGFFCSLVWALLLVVASPFRSRPLLRPLTRAEIDAKLDRKVAEYRREAAPDFPTVPNPLDGLAAPVHNLNPDNRHWTDYLCEFEPYLSPNVDKFMLHYRWMREMDEAMLTYRQHALEIPKEFLDDSLKPGPAEQAMSEAMQIRDAYMTRMLICAAPMYYAKLTVLP